MSEQEQSKLVRYCPECGRIGEVAEGFRDCCPDGSHHFYVPEAIAKQAHAGFQACIYPQPREENILRSHGDWCDAQDRANWYGRTAGDMARHHAEIVEALAASTPSAQNHAQDPDRKDAERYRFAVKFGWPQYERQFYPTEEDPTWRYGNGERFPSPSEAIDAAMAAGEPK